MEVDADGAPCTPFQEQREPDTPGSVNADLAWGLLSPATRTVTDTPRSMKHKLTMEEMRCVVVDALAEICERHGGCLQYLRAKYPDDESKAVYAKKLVEMIPLNETGCFSHKKHSV